MGIRIQYEFTSNHDGVEYKCEIHDVDWAAATNTATGNGFVITYNGADAKPLNNIFGSSCDLQLAWRESDTFMQAFINDLKGANEYEFALVIYRNTELYWVGNITSDSLMWDNDNYTRYITINAIDGLGRLRDMTYDNIIPGVLEEWTDAKQVYEVILDLLSLNNLDQFWEATDPYIVSQPHWILNTSYRDWIDRLSVPRFLFLKDDTEVNIANREPLSAYECLEIILSHLNMRIVHSNGRYYLQQVMGMTGATAAYQYMYYKGNTPVSSSPWKWWQTETTTVTRNRTIGTDITALSGGKFRYMPALRRAEVEVPDRKFIISNIQKDYASTVINPTTAPFTETTELGQIRGGTGKRMQILLDVRQVFFSALTLLRIRIISNRYYFRARVKIIAGSYRLYDNNKTDLSDLEWTNTDTSHSVFVDRWPRDFIYQNGLFINIESPDIPWTSEDVSMEITWDIIDSNTGSSYTMSPVTYYIDINSVTVTFMDAAKVLTQSKLRINNPDITDYENNTTYEHPDYLLDDVGLISNQNSFQLNTTTTTYANVTAVDSGHSTDEVISSTLIMDAMALQMNPIQIYEGPITGEYYPHETMTYDSDVYVFNGGKFDAAADLWDAQWWQSSPELGTVTNPDRENGKGVEYDGDDWVKPYTRIPPPWDHNGDVKDAFYIERIGSGGGSFGATVTSLPLTSATESLLKSGDALIVYNPDTMELLTEVELTADVDATDTTISVTSLTLDNNIPPGSAVMLKGSEGIATPMLRTNELQLGGETITSLAPKSTAVLGFYSVWTLTVTTAGVYYDLNPTPDCVSDKWPSTAPFTLDNAAGTITYTGTPTIRVMITAELTGFIGLTDAVVRQLTCRILRTTAGVAAGSDQLLLLKGEASGNKSVSWFTSVTTLATDEVVKLQISNTTDTADITFNRFSFTIREL